MEAYCKMVGSSGARLFSFLGQGQRAWSGDDEGTGRRVVTVSDADLRLRKTSEGLAAEVERLIAPTMAELGYAIVRVYFGGDRRPKLQLMIERADGSTVNVDDCATASRATAAILDVEDPISTAYVLEVSSPGIDRPLTRLSDFQRFTGHLAKVELAVPQDGRRRFSGTLLGIEDETILLDCEEGPASLAFANMVKAKLVLTDALIAAHQAAEEAADASLDDQDTEVGAVEAADREKEPAKRAGRKGMKRDG